VRVTYLLLRIRHSGFAMPRIGKNRHWKHCAQQSIHLFYALLYSASVWLLSDYP
jgi:hypothetical protein